MAKPSQLSFVRGLLLRSISFLAIPTVGYLGTFVVGLVNKLGSALLGGAIGLLVGIAQSVASTPTRPAGPGICRMTRTRGPLSSSWTWSTRASALEGQSCGSSRRS